MALEEKVKINGNLNTKATISASTTIPFIPSTKEKERVKFFGNLTQKSILNASISGIMKSGGIVEIMASFIAGTDINKYTFIVLESDGLVYPADPTNKSHFNKTVGIATNSAIAGSPISAMLTGVITDENLSLSTGTLYLSLNGTFSSTPPNSACFTQVVGQALSSNQMLVQVHDADFINENSYTLVTASQDLSAYKIVKVDGNYASVYDTDFPNILGITTQFISSGAEGKVLVEGIIEDDSFAFTPNKSLFLGDSGNITQSFAGGNYFCKIGVALTNTKIKISIEDVICL